MVVGSTNKLCMEDKLVNMAGGDFGGGVDRDL